MKIPYPHLKKGLIFTLLCAAAACPAANDLEESATARWQMQHEKYELLDEEKSLLAANDNLEHDIDQCKLAIKGLMDHVDATQSKLASVRHALISVQLRLR
jgi:hypothetical protein